LLPLLGFALFLQVAIPFVAGYYISKKIGLVEEECRTILFQTGICNTALAAILAMETISPLAAVPSVINMVINLSLGALAANYFSRKVKSEHTVEHYIVT
jgi:BASS family bile acid:Na+ symporter